MRQPPEYWRDIPGTNGKYQASRAGEVRHVWPSGKTTLLRPYLLKGGCHKRCRNRLHVHLSLDGKSHVLGLLPLLAKTWLPPLPRGMVWHHVNGNLMDNRIENIRPITRRELGKKTGSRATRKAVEMLDPEGNIIELYPSVREAARANFISHEAVRQRCMGLIKKPLLLTGYTFRYEEPPRKCKLRAKREMEKKK